MKNQYRVNEQIRARDVRVVSDGGAEVMPARKALELARQQELDLVEISPNAQPPVCRIVDYSKFLYQQKKHAKEMKQKQVKVETKEIRFGPQTDEHDYQFKLKHAMEFLNEGNKVRAYVFFRGRSILFKEQGEVLLLRFANDLEEYGKVEQMPKLEGKNLLYLFHINIFRCLRIFTAQQVHTLYVKFVDWFSLKLYHTVISHLQARHFSYHVSQSSILSLLEFVNHIV